MTCILTLAQNPDNIEESQYGTAPEVIFSPITSCILIAARSGEENVSGIHLVMVQRDDEPFSVADVSVVTGVLGGLAVDPSSIVVFGQISMWQDNVGAAFDALIEALGFPPTTDLNDGTYGARIVDGRVSPFNAGRSARPARNAARVRHGLRK